MKETYKTTPQTCNRHPDGFDPQSSSRLAAASTAAFEPSSEVDVAWRRAGNMRGGAAGSYELHAGGSCPAGSGPRTVNTSTLASAMHSQPGDPGQQPGTRAARMTPREAQVGVPGMPETGTAAEAYVADYQAPMPGSVPGDPDVRPGSPGMRPGAVSAWSGPKGTRGGVNTTHQQPSPRQQRAAAPSAAA